MNESETTSPHTSSHTLTVVLRVILGVIIAALGVLAYAYFSTPAALRRPTSDHFHFRLQVITDGKAANFGDDKYQTEFNKDICDAALTAQPIHFHDHLDQFVHIHWAHITGGILLKDYGWNLIGGANHTLGYRFDTLPKVIRVPIHGAALPKAAAGDHYYVYTGNADSYKKRDWKDFLKLDLKDFFAGTPQANLMERLVPAAYAHGAGEDEAAQLNDVVGSVVIFAQKDAPTDAQIKDRFNHLVPLPMSACSG